MDLSRTTSLDPTDGQSFAALGCTGNYDKWEITRIEIIDQRDHQDWNYDRHGDLFDHHDRN